MRYWLTDAKSCVALTVHVHLRLPVWLSEFKAALTDSDITQQINHKSFIFEVSQVIPRFEVSWETVSIKWWDKFEPSSALCKCASNICGFVASCPFIFTLEWARHNLMHYFCLSLIVSKRVRVSTWNRLNLLKGGVLSSAMRQATAHDPAFPVLTGPHLTALDRRLDGVLTTVRQCMETQGTDNTLIEDRMNLPHP